MDQEGDTEMQRICPTCVAAKQSSQATTGNRELGSAASGKGGPGCERANTAAVKGAHERATVEDQEDVAEAVGLDGMEEMTEF